jgi:hypothetical protein
MDVGDAMMMFGRGPGRECGDKNNRSWKRNFCLAKHFLYLLIELGDLAPKLFLAQGERAPPIQGIRMVMLHSDGWLQTI